MSSSRRYTAVSIALLLSTLLIGATEAQMSPAGAPGPSTPQMESSGAPGPSASATDCLTVLSEASDCLTFVEAGSTLAVPEKPCCPEIKKVVDNNPICLCQMLAKNNSIGIEFDVKKALKLPSICKISTPPVSLCSMVGVPVEGPTGSATVAPDSSTPGMSPAATPGNGGTTDHHLSSMATVVGAAIAFLSFVLAF